METTGSRREVVITVRPSARSKREVDLRFAARAEIYAHVAACLHETEALPDDGQPRLVLITEAAMRPAASAEDGPPGLPDGEIIRVLAAMDMAQLRTIIRWAHRRAPLAVEGSIADARSDLEWARRADQAAGPGWACRECGGLQPGAEPGGVPSLCPECAGPVSPLLASIRTETRLPVDDDDIDGDAPRFTRGDDRCGATTPRPGGSPWTCTAQAGHGIAHMALTPIGRELHRWPLDGDPAADVDAAVEADRQAYFQRHEGEPTADAAMTCRRCKNAPALDDDVICAGCEAADAEGIRPLVFVRPDADPAADDGELPASVVPLTSTAIRPLPRLATAAGVQIASVTR